MASNTTKQNKQPQSYLNTKLFIGATGFLLSILLHELFHVIMHWHHITGVEFFPDWFTVAELVVNVPIGYDLDSEEFIAYGISAAVLIITAILIAKVHDDTDKRTVNEMLFPERYRKKSKKVSAQKTTPRRTPKPLA